MDVSIVIVNWNSQEYLRNCLASIFANTREIDIEVIVIDSASFDGCDRMLREHYSEVRFIQSAANLGFARANNLAFEACSGECVLFLNPDTEVVDDAIVTLYRNIQALPEVGVIGCRLLNSDGTVQTSCIQAIPTILNQLLDAEVLRRRWPTLRLWGMAPLFNGEARPQEIEAVSGACLMLKRRVFEQVGRFTEDYFMYAEDIDLAYKTRHAGYRNYFVRAATVIHYGGSSSEQAANTFSAVMLPEAIFRFLRRTRGWSSGFGYRVTMGASAVVRLLLLTIARPVLAGGGRRASWKASVRKWGAVLRWSLYRDNLVKRYYGG